MAKLKTLIPTVADLEKRIEDSFGVHISEFVASTARRRGVVLENRQYAITALGILLLSFIALFLFYSYLEDVGLGLVALCLFVLAATTIFFNYRWFREQKLLAQEFNLALIPTITACFDRLALYTYDEVHHRETEAMLRESGLLPESYTAVTADDMYSFYEPYPISVREISIEQQQSTGKTTITTEIFHGVFVEVVLNKTLEGTTYISTEGDVFGLAHQNFWGLRVADAGIEETELEWNEFEEDLHVLSNNPTETRTILTPDFMVDLHTWWKEREENIRIAFRGNKMYMLLPDARVKIHTSTTSADPEAIKVYAKTVLQPLWRVLLLVEDVAL